MFKERNEAEKGFSAIWENEIAPGLENYAPEYARKKNLAIYGNVVLAIAMIFVFGVVSLIDPWVGENSNAIFFFVLVLVSTALGFDIAYPHTKLVNAYTEYLKNTVAGHFSERFAKPEGDDKG